MAEQALERSRRPEDLHARSIAHRATAIAARELHDLDAAHRSATDAARTGEAAGAPSLQGLALLTLASIQLAAGANDDALVTLAAAEPLVDAADLANLRMQEATILQRSDRTAEALIAFDAALVAARASGDRLAEALALVNRGVLYTYAGRFAAADDDLASAEATFIELDLELAAADARHNRGFVAATAGDVAVALEQYGGARRTYERLGVERPNALLDEASALAEAQLVRDAIDATTVAVGQLRRAGESAHLAEALLLLAELLHGTARRQDAVAAAEEARQLFAEQARSTWLVRADAVSAQLRDDLSPAEVRALAARLEAAGWTDDALEARRRAGWLAEQLGDLTAARADYDAVAAHRRRGPAARRVHAWHALAQRRLLDRDDAGATRAATAGLRVAERNALALAAADVRSSSAAPVEPLISICLGAALRAQRPERILKWSDRWRSRSLRYGRVRAPELPELIELRTVLRDLGDPTTPSYQRAELDTRRRRLEATADRRLRGAAASATVAPAHLDAGQLRTDLGHRTLIELVVHDGLLHRISAGPNGTQLHAPRPLAEVTREVRAIRLAASRITSTSGDTARHTAAMTAASTRLDRLLFEDVALTDEAVVVPTGALHAVPWPLLPSLAERRLTVAPSASGWAASTTPILPRRPRAVVVAFGVGNGDDEAALVAATYRDASVLTGEAATVPTVLSALEDADIAHIAVHATFRADNPQYSALHLADGPLLVHDLDRIRRAPPIVVLSACGAAQLDVSTGDELLGVTASFLRAGTSTLVASTLPVTDDQAPSIMKAFHEALRSAPPAAALRIALGEGAAEAGGAFTCFGRA